MLISGRGSNLAALIAAAKARSFPAASGLVVSDRASSPGLAYARGSGIPTAVVERAAADSRMEFEMQLDAALRDAGIELICLAGFMRILSKRFVDSWHDCILNIHPSLLPDYPGLDTHARVLAAGESRHGATVHFVRPAVDDGPIVLQKPVAVLRGDTPEKLAARVLAVEHEIYPRALALVASGKAKAVGDRVEIEGESEDAAKPAVKV